MTRRHTIEAERIADDGGEFVAASLAIEFNHTAPAKHWHGYDPPDDEEIEFHAAYVLIDHRWIGIPWQAPLSEWAAKWLDEHHDEAREAAGEDDDAAREARAEARRDD